MLLCSDVVTHWVTLQGRLALSAAQADLELTAFLAWAFPLCFSECCDLRCGQLGLAVVEMTHRTWFCCVCVRT